MMNGPDVVVQREQALASASLALEHSAEARASGKLENAVNELEQAVKTLMATITPTAAPVLEGLLGHRGRPISLKDPRTLLIISDSSVSGFANNGVKAIIAVLLDDYLCGGDGVSKEDLAEITNYKPSSVSTMVSAWWVIDGFSLLSPKTSENNKYRLIRDTSKAD